MSNHGARSEDSGRSTIDALPEILDAVGGRMPISWTAASGGAQNRDGAGHGRQGRLYRPAVIWGLGAFGQAGVERVLELLRIELRDHAADGRAHNQALDARDGPQGVTRCRNQSPNRMKAT